ncbi:MAG: hypothetical protein HY364_04795 [Candidatus Aenigmarchaeota archaeon]|nr:hypothetical protein [Candidatus Aenigmarchaeota archaeon]
MDDFRQLIERLNGLEAKLRNTFVQIDQRLGELETIKTENSEQRLQEIEDLMLLLQVENTKIREAIGKKEDSSFLDASFMPDDAKMHEKIDILEQQVRGMASGATASNGNELETRMNQLENRLDELSQKGLSSNEDVAEMDSELKSIRRSDGNDVEKRIAALEEKIGSMDSSSSVMPEDFGKRIRDLEEKIESLGEPQSVKELEESVINMQSYVKEKLEAIDPSRMSDIVTKKGLQEYMSKLSAAREGIEQDMEKMASMKNDIDTIASMKKELEEKLSRQSADSDKGVVLLEKIQIAERRLDEKLGEIDNLSKQMDNKLAEAGEKLSAGGNINAKELEYRFGRMEKTIQDTEQKYRHIDSSIEKNLHAIKELSEQLEEESVGRVSLEKNFQDMKGKVDKIAVMDKELEKERRVMKEMAESTSLKNSEIDKKLEGLQKKISVINEFRKDLDEESVSRVSIEKSMQEIRNEMESMLKVGKSLDKEKKDVQKLAESYSSARETINEKLSALDKKIEELDSMKNELHRERNEAKKAHEKNNSVEADISGKMEDISKELSDLEHLRKELREEKYQLRKLAESSGEELRAKIAGIEKGMQEFYKVKNDVNRDKEEIKSILNDNQVRSAEIEKLMHEITGEMKDIGDMRKLVKAGETYTSNVERRVKELENHIQHISRLKMELESESVNRLADEKIINDIKRQFSAIETRVEKFTSIPSEMHAMLAAIEHLRQNAGNELEARTSLEQGINDMRQRLQGMEALWKGFDASSKQNQAEHIDPAFMDKLGEMQRRLDSIEQKTLQNPSPTEHAKIGEELNMHITDFSNQMNALRGRLMQESSEFSQFIKQNDINQFRKEMKDHNKMLRSIDKRIEKSAMKFFAENLEDFARAMDRKAPAFVTREAYEKDMQALGEKLRKIEAPESAALYERMDSLERDIGRTIVAMRSMMSRVPVVVE